MQRKSRLTASRFVDLLLFADQKLDQLSLNDLVTDFNEQYGASLSKQGLQERFNDQAVAFLSSLLKLILERRILSLSPSKQLFASNFFKKVKLKDSTRFALPEQYAYVYKGHGGVSSPAQISIQFEYDLLSGQIIDLALTSAVRNDQQDSKETLHKIEKGELVIRDLAYAGKEYIDHIEKIGAYYLNRLNPRWHVLTQEKEKIDFNKILKRINRMGSSYLEQEVYIKYGKKNMKTRLIATKVPQQVYQRRIKEATRAAKSKGYQLTREYKTKAQLNLFITNVPAQWLNTKQVHQIYHLRWQIELIFKSWKSMAYINKMKSMRVQRFQCQLIARFIWIILHWQALLITQKWINKQSIKVKCSIWKFYKMAYRVSGIFRNVIFGALPISEWMTMLLRNAETKYKTETRKGKLSSMDLLALILT